MSSAHNLLSPPSSISSSERTFDVGFSSPVYKVVLLPSASYFSPASVLPCRPDVPRRKVARRQPMQQLQFTLTDADGDNSFPFVEARDGPSASCNASTEGGSPPVHGECPPDRETENGVEKTAAISNFVPLQLRSDWPQLSETRNESKGEPYASVVAQRHRTAEAAVRKWREAMATEQTRRLVVYALETWKRRTLISLRLRRLLMAKRNAVMNKYFSKWHLFAKHRMKADLHRKKALMATSMTKWVEARVATKRLHKKNDKAERHSEKKQLEKSFYAWCLWTQQQVCMKKAALQFREEALVSTCFRHWKALHFEGVASVGVATRGVANERWKPVEQLWERKIEFTNKRKAFSAWRVFICLCNLKELSLVYQKQREMVTLQSSFSHWVYRATVVQADTLLFSKLASAQKRELLETAFMRWIQAMEMSRKAKSVVHVIQKLHLLKCFQQWKRLWLCVQFKRKHYLHSCVRQAFRTWRLCLQDHTMTRKAECNWKMSHLGKCFELWRRRMAKRKERALEKQAHEHYNRWLERRFFITWRGRYSQMKLNSSDLEAVVKSHTLKFYFMCWKRQCYCILAARRYSSNLQATHLNSVFLAWRITANQHSSELLHQFLVRLLSAISKDPTVDINKNHQLSTELKSALSPSTALVQCSRVRESCTEPQSPVQKAHKPQSPVQHLYEVQSPNQYTHELWSPGQHAHELQSPVPYHSPQPLLDLSFLQTSVWQQLLQSSDSTGLGKKGVKRALFQDMDLMDSQAVVDHHYSNITAQYLPLERVSQLPPMIATKDTVSQQDPLLVQTKGVESGDGGDGGGGVRCGRDGVGGASDGAVRGASGVAFGGDSGRGIKDTSVRRKHVPGAKWKLVSNVVLLPRLCTCMNTEVTAQIRKVRETLEVMSHAIASDSRRGTKPLNAIATRHKHTSLVSEYSKNFSANGDSEDEINISAQLNNEQGQPTLCVTQVEGSSWMGDCLKTNTFNSIPGEPLETPPGSHEPFQSPPRSQQAGPLLNSLEGIEAKSSAIQSPPSSHGTIQSPSSSHETIQSPSNSHETIQSPSSSHETIQSPSSSHETIQSPSSSHETIQSPSSSHDVAISASTETLHSSVLARLICIVRYMKLYPCSKQFYVWRTFVQRKSLLKQLLHTFCDHKLGLCFRHWRNSTTASVKLRILQAELKEKLDVTTTRRCVLVWRKALRGRLYEYSQDVCASEHHYQSVVRYAFSVWRDSYQLRATAEAEKALQGEEVLIKRLALRQWKTQAKRRKLARRTIRKWRHFARVRHMELQAQTIAHYWRLSDAWSAWRNATVTKRTVTYVVNATLLKMAFLSWRTAVHANR